MRNFILILALLIFSMACSSDIRSSVFVEDPLYEGLPVYSEWGYNTFGAYYDRDSFTSNYVDSPLKMITSEGMTSFEFHGDVGYGEGMKMIVRSSKFLVDSYTELLTLDGLEIDLTSDEVELLIERENAAYEFVALNVEVLEGGFEVRNAQRLFIDDTVTGYILSGYFDFRALINDKPVAMTAGRYDVLIGEEAYFNY